MNKLLACVICGKSSAHLSNISVVIQSYQLPGACTETNKQQKKKDEREEKGDEDSLGSL